MIREEYIKNLKNQGKVTVKDLGELLTFTLDKSNELMFEDDHIEVYIPINFDELHFPKDVTVISEAEYRKAFQ